MQYAGNLCKTLVFGLLKKILRNGLQIVRTAFISVRNGIYDRSFRYALQPYFFYCRARYYLPLNISFINIYYELFSVIVYIYPVRFINVIFVQYLITVCEMKVYTIMLSYSNVHIYLAISFTPNFIKPLY